MFCLGGGIALESPNNDSIGTLTVTKDAPSFSSLSAPTIAGGATWTAISGHLDANAGGPPEAVRGDVHGLRDQP